MATDVWTPSILSKMKTLLARGLSTAEIGKKIGMSKNAVVGKLNRLGWNAKSNEVPKKKNKPVVAKTVAVKPKPTNKKTSAAAKTATVKKPAKAPAKKTAAAKTPAKKTSVAKPTKKMAVPARGAAEKTGAKRVSVPKANSKTLAMHQRIIQHSMEMAALRPDQCRWPIGDPDSEDFHFCGEPVFVGKPYCYEHCKVAYQFQQPTKKKS